MFYLTLNWSRAIRVSGDRHAGPLLAQCIRDGLTHTRMHANATLATTTSAAAAIEFSISQLSAFGSISMRQNESHSRAMNISLEGSLARDRRKRAPRNRGGSSSALAVVANYDPTTMMNISHRPRGSRLAPLRPVRAGAAPGPACALQPEAGSRPGAGSIATRSSARVAGTHHARVVAKPGHCVHLRALPAPLGWRRVCSRTRLLTLREWRPRHPF